LGGQPPKEFGVGIPGGYEESLYVAGYSGHPSVSLGGFQKLDDLKYDLVIFCLPVPGA